MRENSTSIDQLGHKLHRLDGKGYKAYKDIKGSYFFEEGTFYVDYVQGDPFATPSRIRVRIRMNELGIPEELWESKTRSIALEDWLARRIRAEIKKGSKSSRGTGKSGLINIDAGRQEVIERTAVKVTPEWVEVRLEAGLPAAGRKILGRQASDMLVEEIPDIVLTGLDWNESVAEQGYLFVQCVENQEHIRQKLNEKGLIAFVADQAVLPRESGVSDRPMERGKCIPFSSPDDLRVEIDVPNPVSSEYGGGKKVSGMGIKEGVWLIVGGGYHGKSTLLRALERGVYPHVPGDGREYVVTDPNAVSVQAEDRRRVEGVNIDSFISGIPGGLSTTFFCTEEASGSTSQAASLVEALESGARALLIDEDASATNLMIRDARMQALVEKTNEPITPLVDRIRELYDQHGVSTIMVMGGSGDYFDVADEVIMLRDYRVYYATDEAKKVADEFPSRRSADEPAPFQSIQRRIPDPGSFDASRGKKSVKIDAPSAEEIRFGTLDIDLRYIEQLTDRSQTAAIGQAIYYAAQNLMNNQITLPEILDELESQLDKKGLEVLGKGGESHPGNLARFRRHELASAINRLRSLVIKNIK